MDMVFQEAFDYVLHDRFEMFEDEDLFPDEYDLEQLMWDLGDLQQTYNSLRIHYDLDDDSIQYVLYEDYQYIPFKEPKSIWFDDPVKQKFSKYPKYFLCKV